MNTAPDTQVLYSLRESSMRWRDIVGELLDNSLDADATRVEIGWDKGAFRISDDGRGVAPAEFEAFFRLGRHVATGSRRKALGRYGIGLKEACGRLWGETNIVSTRDGTRAEVRVEWERWAKSQAWSLADPTVSVAPPQAKGTEIVCRSQMRAPQSDEFMRLMKDVDFIFSPAIRRGVQIVYSLHGRRRHAETFETPELIDRLVGDLDVHGKAARVTIGIVPEGEKNEHSGLHYCYGHRVILPSSNLGCGTFNASRIFGWVVLDDSWRLSKHKNEITDEAREELGRAVEQVCAPVLAKAGQIADVVALRELDLAATEALRADLGGISNQEREDKARRKQRDGGTGTVTPKRTGRRHNDAGERQHGETLLPKTIRNQLRIQHGDLPEDRGVGYFDKEARVVKINTADPTVKQMIAEQRITGLGGTHQLAIVLLLQRAAMDETVRGLLPFMRNIDDETNRFSVALSRIMAGWLTTESAKHQLA